MGRKSTLDAVLDREYDALVTSGLDHNESFDRAWDKAKQAVEDKKEHRRKRNAHYQYMHRWRKQYDEKIRLERESKEVKPVTYVLSDEESLIIDAYRNDESVNK